MRPLLYHLSYTAIAYRGHDLRTARDPVLTICAESALRRVGD